MGKLNAGCALIVCFIVVMAIIGEVRCLYKFFTSDFEPSYKREIVYGAGAFSGLGSIIGWFNIEDTPKTAQLNNARVN